MTALAPSPVGVEHPIVAGEAGDPHQGVDFARRGQQPRPGAPAVGQGQDVLAELALKEGRGVGAGGGDDVALEPDGVRLSHGDLLFDGRR